MNDKEIGELRRRLRPDRTNITSVYGCYVSDSREILSTFRQSLSICTEDDKELYLGLLKKALSGSIDKNLLDLSFRTQQVADSDEHRLLMKLRETKLSDEETLQTFYQTVIDSLSIEGHYLILLALVIITASHRYYHIHICGLHSLKLRFHLFNHGIYEWII